MDKRSSRRYLIAGISWGGIVAFVIVFGLGARFPGATPLTLALTLWGGVLIWPTIIALLIRWRGNERWINSSTEAFFWLSLFMSPIMSLLAFA